jgi:hypothetical protein
MKDRKQQGMIMKSKREEYIDKMAQQLKEWSATIDELEYPDCRGLSRREGRLRGPHQGAEREKREALSLKLDELREAGGIAWTALRSGVEIAWKDPRDAVSAASEKFKKAAEHQARPGRGAEKEADQ